MTLLEKIEAYVASQGNQVGGGSEFADLLKEIVNSIPQGGNEPLIIKGFIDDGEEKVSIEDTIKGAQAYLEGRIVLYKNPESDNITNMVVTCHPYSGIILGDGTNIEA